MTLKRKRKMEEGEEEHPRRLQNCYCYNCYSSRMRAQPWNRPVVQPSVQPSVQLSVQLPVQLSVQPSVELSVELSVQPLAQPLPQPSVQPSAQPSAQPSPFQPSWQFEPSCQIPSGSSRLHHPCPCPCPDDFVPSST
mmetsp:Transcript_917/g.2786  ORF Transcript_917/g.2786 Transcript_917/m.2786 type:complete len:137 (+) Transcript_917:856-1266(+)